MIPQLQTIRVIDIDLFTDNKFQKDYDVADPFLYVLVALRRSVKDWLIVNERNRCVAIDPERDAKRIIRTEKEIMLYHKTQANHTRSYRFINHKAWERKVNQKIAYAHDPKRSELHRRINMNTKNAYAKSDLQF